MKQLTDQAFAQVREASVKAEDCIQAMTDGPHRGDWGNTLDVLEKALAALDTAQSVQPVGHISTKLGVFVQEGSWIGPLPVNKLFYAVSDRYSAAAPQPKEPK